MNISRFTDYSFRVLIFLAVNAKRKVTIKEVAQRFDISKNHLMKVVQRLNREQLIVAKRGKNGGIQLDRDPKDIHIGRVVRLFENQSTLLECLGKDNRCVITPACQLKGMFSGAMEAFFSFLDPYTLADLVHENNITNLAANLGIIENFEVNSSELGG